MADARTGPLSSSNQSSKLRSRRKERSFSTNHFDHDTESSESQVVKESDARTFYTDGSNRRSKSSGLRALQELVSDARTILCEARSARLPSRLPQPMTQKPPKHSQKPSAVSAAKQSDDDFAKYLGLSDAAGSTVKRSRHRRSEHRRSSMQQQQPLPPATSTYPAPEEDFDEENKLCCLIGSMLDQVAKAEEQTRRQSNCTKPANQCIDAAAITESLHPFVYEFGDRVFRLQFRTAFPFSQPEMLEMFNLLAGNHSSTSDSELLLRQGLADLRSIHLQMRLFLDTDATLAEVDDAELSSLLMTFAEQVDRDLSSSSAGGSSSGRLSNVSKYAARRAAVLTAAIGRYARTVERRRQLVLDRMQSLATTVMGFVACSPSDGVGDGSLRKTVVTLFDDMLACFTCLAGSVGSVGCGNSNSGDNIPRPASPTPATDGLDSDDEECVRDVVRGDTPSRLPPPPASFLEPDFLLEPQAAMEPVSDNEGTERFDEDPRHTTEVAENNQEAAIESTVNSLIEPEEAFSIQFMERLEGLLSSFRPNERVDNQEFKTAFNALFEWWRRACSGCANRSLERRVTAIKEKFDSAQKLRTESNGVKRLYSESETTWDLIEVAKLMVPSEERTAYLVETQTAAEYREPTLSLVDSVLARLYLYQLAQDSSVLSARLRSDLQRLINRLANCGPVPMLNLLRLRLLYIRSRQYSDLLRAHPQGCLILELTQIHRVLNRDAYPEGAITCPLNLTICVPLNDYKKFYQYVKDLRVLSFEARAPVTEKSRSLMKTNCLRKIEKCCQCSIEVLPPGCGSGVASDAATCGATVNSPSTLAIAQSSAETAQTASNRRKLQLLVGVPRPTFGLVVRPDQSHGRANAAMRMISDTAGQASISDRVKYRSFHLCLLMPHNYKPATVFSDISRPLNC
ncbi:hypothetical protein BOX15_Mlig014050g2 [Macrostomum lignano]|uniref:Uncharacterized protein n=1 Tax=Macrostomum lignano TaxID=282301 RepID=A0A267EGC6_9PLAT|nr:hypothetical protein BOX15_Mlig014050g2 [Macrostomum lignano]